jgi:hypothetical protein
MKYDNIPPAPSAMLESMRAYGYSLPMAVADLIDNSISASASTVWLDFHWGGQDSWISIIDNGNGMTEDQLVAAMRLGSQSPLEEREADDLGRFGLGLKTASFSQCRRLTVRTLQDGIESIRCWDLDFIAENARHNKDQWLLLRSAAKGSESRAALPEELKKGTVVLWEGLDRIIDDSPISDDKAQQVFFRHIDQVKQYLAMVFHRFLEGNSPRLKLYVNGKQNHNRIMAWNPFLDSHPCTEKTPEEHITDKGHTVSVRGYILPHKNKLEKEEHQRASGPEGWNAQQGFYVYRNQRLLVSGSWLGLGRNRSWTKEEHYKLARIKVDIPNSMDQEWQLDVKKSIAVPPPAIRSRLLELAKEVRQKARSVFAHRGKYGSRHPRADIVRPWIPKTRNGRPVYLIDRTNPLVQEAIRIVGESREVIDNLLEVIEETVPIQQIWLDTSEKPDSHMMPFEHKSKKEVRFIVYCAYGALLTKGLTSEEAKDDLSRREEFSEYQDLIKSLE